MTTYNCRNLLILRILRLRACCIYTFTWTVNNRRIGVKTNENNVQYNLYIVIILSIVTVDFISSKRYYYYYYFSDFNKRNFRLYITQFSAFVRQIARNCYYVFFFYVFTTAAVAFDQSKSLISRMLHQPVLAGTDFCF